MTCYSPLSPSPFLVNHNTELTLNFGRSSAEYYVLWILDLFGITVPGSMDCDENECQGSRET